MSDLMPCPFCGCKTVNVRTRKTTLVECDDCKAVHIHSAERDAIAAWNRRAATADARAGWATIESAPKDGKAILCGRSGVKPYIGFWCLTNHAWLDHKTGYEVFREPTHWQPIPPPPRPDR